MKDKLRNAALSAAKNAYSPYSKVKVGAAVLTESGEIFSGCNVENSSFGGTVCAERVAIFKAISEGERKIKELYVYTEAGWPPCGMCRQVMSEFGDQQMKVYIGDKKETLKESTLDELLPLAFTSDKLLK